MTSALAREYGSQRGAEEIAGWLNRVFGAIIECVHNYQGSVVSFSGDAITCWFDDHPVGEPRDSQAAYLRAAACAFAMQETMAQFRSIRLSSSTTTSLHIKVVVIEGPARRFEIGRPEIQRMDVLAGSLLNCVNVAENLLSQDEIIVSEGIVQFLGPDLEIQEWRAEDGQRFAVVSAFGRYVPESRWVETPVLPLDVALEWMCTPIMERLNMAEGAFLAELRASVVTLYLSFSGLDYDEDDNAREKLDRFISWVQLTLSHYEGFLLQLTVGDKGSYILATFGAILAHEDDPIRALEAALALQELPADLEAIQDIKIGISLGTLYSGAFGGPTRQTYGVLGGEANIGARLMSTAKPGQIVVSSQLVDAAGARYDFEELGLVQLKGVTNARRLFLLKGRQDQGLKLGADIPVAAPLVGRSMELAILLAKLNALQNGQSGTVVIEGDPGIGKSKLTTAFLEKAREADVTILLGAGDAIEQGTPYYAWRPVFRSLFDLTETLDPAGYQEKIMANIPDDPDIKRLVPLLNAVLPTNFPDNDLTEKIAGEARANSTRNLLLDLLAGTFTESSGVVLILEDAHWLDSASWALAAQLRQTLSPLLLVIVTRPIIDQAIQAKEADSLLAGPDSEHINLSTMSPEEISVLVRRQLGVNTVPQSIIDLILKQGEGHPFYSEEIAYALRDTGYLLVEGNSARLANPAATLQDIDFPATIQGVITSRVDKLDVSEQLTLKVASVIGRLFAYHVLSSIYPERSIVPSLPGQLNKFEQLNITSLEAPDPDLTYLFRHIITQEVIYNLMTFSQRQWLHQIAAQWYEEKYTADLTTFYPLLAYHWRRAENPAKAVDYLDKAGRQALRDNANKEAIGFFAEIRELAAASELQSDALSQATWARQIADGYVGLGDVATGRTYYEEAAKLLDQPIPRSRSRLVIGLLGQLATQTLHRLWPSRPIHRTRNVDASLESARAYHGLGFIYYLSNETLPFVHATLKALNLAEPAGLSRSLAEGYATLCVIASLLPGDRLSELYARMAMSTAEELDDPSVLGNVFIRIAVYHNGMAHWRRAEEAADQAIAHYESINDLRGWGDSVNVQLYNLYYTGRFDACHTLGQALYQTARRNENVQHQAWGLWMSAKSLIRLGQHDQAAAFLEEAQAATELESLHILGALALAYWYKGLAQKALETIRQVDISVGEASPNFATLSANANVAETYLLAWQAAEPGSTGGQGADSTHPADAPNPTDAALLPEIKAGARQACKTLHNFSRVFPIGKPAAWLYQGNLDWLEGKASKAYKSWRKAISLAEQVSMPYELARAHYELGRHSPPDDPQRQKHFQAAVEGFEQLGAAEDLRRSLAEKPI